MVEIGKKIEKKFGYNHSQASRMMRFIGILTLTCIDSRQVTTHITPNATSTESDCIQSVWHMFLDKVIAFESDVALQCLQEATFDLANENNEDEEHDIILTTKADFVGLHLTKETLLEILDKMLYNSYHYTLDFQTVRID